jgi:mono/diheme cytochrome c family protein
LWSLGYGSRSIVCSTRDSSNSQRHRVILQHGFQAPVGDSLVMNRFRSLSLFLLLSGTFICCNADSGGIPPGSLADGDAPRGKALYAAHCSGCHGAEGRGDGPGAANINPKPIDHTDHALMTARSDSTLFLVIRKGGSIVSKPAMPPFPNLTDQEIKDIIAFMREISQPK